MTKLGHMVWSEKSQNYVKSSLPEGTVIKLPEEPTEAGWGVARIVIVAKTETVEEPNETESCQNDANISIPVVDEDAVEPNETTESCRDIAEDTMKVKAEDTEMPTEKRSDVARDSEEIMKISPLTK